MLLAEIQYQGSFDEKFKELKDRQELLKEAQGELLANAILDCNDLRLKTIELGNEVNNLSESLKESLKEFEGFIRTLSAGVEDCIDECRQRFEPNLNLLLRLCLRQIGDRYSDPSAELPAQDKEYLLKLLDVLRMHNAHDMSKVVFTFAVINSSNEQISKIAFNSILGAPNSAEYTKYLKRLYKDADLESKKAIIKIITKLSSQPINFLLNALREAPKELELLLVESLCEVKSVSKTKVKTLISKFENEDLNVRLIILNGLKALGDYAKPAESMLFKELKINKNRLLRQRIVDVLAKISLIESPDNPVNLSKILARDMKSKDLKLRQGASEILIDFHADPKTIVPVLKKALSDDDSWVRENTCKALWKYIVSSEDAFPEIIHAIKKDLLGINRTLEQTLKLLGEKAACHLPTVIQCLKNEKRTYCITSHVLTCGTAAMPYLIECLNDEDEAVRGQIAESLGSIPPNKESMYALVLYLDDRHHYVKRSAAKALGRHASYSKEIYLDLIKALNTPDPIMIREICFALIEYARVYPDIIKEVREAFVKAENVRLSGIFKDMQHLNPIKDVISQALKELDKTQ